MTDMAKARRAMLGKIHIGAKALGLDEDDYRALVKRVTGHASAGHSTAAQLDMLIAELKRLGWRPDVQRRARPADYPVARKARALWISLHALGVIHDVSERGLEKFAKRQLGVDRLQWADQSQGYLLIEALKSMAQRNGWDQNLPSNTPLDERAMVLKRRLAALLQAQLGDASASISPPLEEMSGHELDMAVQSLGRRLRAMRQAGG